jgi:hypothetical protein
MKEWCKTPRKMSSNARLAIILAVIAAGSVQVAWSQATRPASRNPERSWLVTGRLSEPGLNSGLYGSLLAIPALGAGTVAGTTGEFRLYVHGHPGCHELVIPARGGYATRYFWLPLGRDSIVELGVITPMRYRVPDADPFGETRAPPAPADTVARCQPAPPRVAVEFPAAHAVLEARVSRGGRPVTDVRVWPRCSTGIEALRWDTPSPIMTTNAEGLVRTAIVIRFPQNLLLAGGEVPCRFVVDGPLLRPQEFELRFGPIKTEAPVTHLEVRVPEPGYDLTDPIVAYDSLLRPGTVLYRFGVLSGGLVGQRGRLVFEPPPISGRAFWRATVALKDSIRRTESAATMTANTWIPWDSVRIALPAIRINTGGQRVSMGARLSLVLPERLRMEAPISEGSEDTGTRLWALMRVPLRYALGSETYRIIPATYDRKTGVLTVEPGVFDFDDERTPDHSNEAVILIARIAGLSNACC